MELCEYIRANLKTLKWHKMTKHYKQMLLPLVDTLYGKIMSGNGDHWLQANDEVVRLPHYLWLTIVGQNSVTQIYGPFMFINNFEKTREAAYLKSMLSYEQLTPIVMKKVTTLLKDFELWIKINQEVVVRGSIHMQWLKEASK